MLFFYLLFLLFPSPIKSYGSGEGQLIPFPDSSSIKLIEASVRDMIEEDSRFDKKQRYFVFHICEVGYNGNIFADLSMKASIQSRLYHRVNGRGRILVRSLIVNQEGKFIAMVYNNTLYIYPKDDELRKIIISCLMKRDADYFIMGNLGNETSMPYYYFKKNNSFFVLVENNEKKGTIQNIPLRDYYLVSSR